MRILRSALLAAFRYMNTMQFINHNHHAVHYTPRISVPFDHPHPCCLVSTPIPANTNLSLYLWVQFVYLLHSTYKGDCIFVFLCLTSFSIMFSNVFENDRIFFIFRLNDILYLSLSKYMNNMSPSTSFSLSVHWWTFRLFPCLGYCK